MIGSRSCLLLALLIAATAVVTSTEGSVVLTAAAAEDEAPCPAGKSSPPRLYFVQNAPHGSIEPTFMHDSETLELTIIAHGANKHTTWFTNAPVYRAGRIDNAEPGLAQPGV